MPAFSVTPLTDVPPPQAADFPDFIQFQAAGTDLGLPDADTLNFSTGMTATRGTGENSNVVTVTASGGGASFGVIELTNTPEALMAFNGALFNNWQDELVITNDDWVLESQSILRFLATGIYRIIATCMVEAGGGAWPAGTSLYGSQVGTSAATQSRYHADYDTAELTTVMRWTDQHVVSVAAINTTFECSLFAQAATTDYAVAAFAMTLVIERLGDYPA